jgi:hypothetical protein
MGLVFVAAVVDRSPTESGEIDPASTVESAASGSDIGVAPGVGFFFMVRCSLGRRETLGRHGHRPKSGFYMKAIDANRVRGVLHVSAVYLLSYS